MLFRSRLLLLGKDVLLFMNVSRVFFFVTYEKSCALFFFFSLPMYVGFLFFFLRVLLLLPREGFCLYTTFFS